jgi:hypothetical protein
MLVGYAGFLLKMLSSDDVEEIGVSDQWRLGFDSSSFRCACADAWG